MLSPVFRIRISFYADPNPGSQKCPYGSGSKGVNTKEEKYTNKFSTKSFKITLKNHYKLTKNYKRILTCIIPVLYTPNEHVF